MKSLICSILFLLVPVMTYSQIELTSYDYDLKDFVLVDRFYEQNKDCIEKYANDTITCIDFILYSDVYDKENDTFQLEHIYALFEEHIYIDGNKKNDITFFIRDNNEPKKFKPLLPFREERFTQLGEFKYIFMPCQFIVRLENGGKKHKVAFERVIKATYIEETFN